MQLGMIGLGRMGASMVRRLMQADHVCVVQDTRPEADFANQVLSAMRHAVGGHLEKPAGGTR